MVFPSFSMVFLDASEVVMRCKTWCLDLEENKVAEVYAEQIKDRVLRFGLEHPGSQARRSSKGHLIYIYRTVCKCKYIMYI